MTHVEHTDPPTPWDPASCTRLAAELWTLRQSLLTHQQRLAPWTAQARPAHRPSAVNLAHYLALRQVDARRLQDQLSWMGLSSLGRSETHVLANLHKVLGLLHRLADKPWADRSAEEPVGSRRGPALLAHNAQALFGAAPKERGVRIMVTLPNTAAVDTALVDSLVATGMDIARINCAHDTAADWAAMAQHVRHAARTQGRAVRVLMDLGGPKLRTGPVAPPPKALRLKARRDNLGRVTQPALLGLHAAGSPAAVGGAAQHVGVDAAWLAAVKPGSALHLVDTRGAQRKFRVTACGPGGALAAADRTVCLGPETRLHLRRKGHDDLVSAVHDLPQAPGEIPLHCGDTLLLLREGPGYAAGAGAGAARSTRHARIACTLPEALDQARAGERIWFDDGRIGGVVQRRTARGLQIQITRARDGGERLLADKGINLPDTRLDLPALTAKDLQDLDTVVQHADMVGLSFAQGAADVQQLQRGLAERGAAGLGMLLKIETRRGFEHLPEMLLAAMASPAAGVMIARGDLAVECGYERLAEVQEEILWACEAAHMPVVWATQVLETLAKTGVPSRAEITDAAMGERAECVMLNKGPHILEAMRTLDDILRRMQSHQSKKRPLLRALKSWIKPMPPAPAPAPSTAPTTAPTAAPTTAKDSAKNTVKATARAAQRRPGRKPVGAS